MDLDHEKSIIDKIRGVQRNWDTSKTIPEEHIQHWIYIAQNSPSKQDEAYYNLRVITDRTVLDTLVEHTYGFTIPVIPEKGVWGIIRNPQMCASAYFLFTAKTPSTIRTRYVDGRPRDPSFLGRRDNGLVSIGLALGLIAQSAASMGYATGFCKNHGQEGSPSHSIWRATLGIPEGEEITYGIGIGYPLPDKPRNYSPETKILVGEHPSTVYDITKDTHIEHEGVLYPLPELAFNTYSNLGPKDITVYRI
jgi:nitroreductase